MVVKYESYKQSLHACPKIIQTKGSNRTVFNWRWYQLLRELNTLYLNLMTMIYTKNNCIY